MLLCNNPFHRIITIVSSTPHECSGAAINYVSLKITTIIDLAFFSLATISPSNHEPGNGTGELGWVQVTIYHVVPLTCAGMPQLLSHCIPLYRAWCFQDLYSLMHHSTSHSPEIPMTSIVILDFLFDFDNHTRNCHVIWVPQVSATQTRRGRSSIDRWDAPSSSGPTPVPARSKGSYSRSPSVIWLLLITSKRISAGSPYRKWDSGPT